MTHLTLVLLLSLRFGAAVEQVTVTTTLPEAVVEERDTFSGSSHTCLAAAQRVFEDSVAPLFPADARYAEVRYACEVTT